MLKHWMTAAAGATLLIALSAGANAGVAIHGGALIDTARTTSAVEKVATRRCWWRNGERHCRVTRGPGPRVYGYGPGSNGYSGSAGTDYYAGARPEQYPTGSTAWWRAMDAEDRGGFGDR